MFDERQDDAATEADRNNSVPDCTLMRLLQHKSITPARTGTAQRCRSAISTVLLAQCARADMIEVGTMTASDVPTASGIATSGSYPRMPNIS